MRRNRTNHADSARRAKDPAAKRDFRVGFFGGLAASLLCALLLLAVRLGF